MQNTTPNPFHENQANATLVLKDIHELLVTAANHVYKADFTTPHCILKQLQTSTSCRDISVDEDIALHSDSTLIAEVARQIVGIIESARDGLEEPRVALEECYGKRDVAVDIEEYNEVRKCLVSSLNVWLLGFV